MRIEVLGCCGGAAPGCRTTSLLINDTVALDAGALAEALTIERQLEVRSVVLTHGHADHVLTLPFFVDNVVSRGGGPVDVHASATTIASVREHLFNDVVWPDFTRIPDRSRPVLRFHGIEAGETLEVGGVRLTAIPVNHSVPTLGFLIEEEGRAVLWSADTGPTWELWRVANRTPGLEALFVEVSFANDEQPLAEISDHLTPLALQRELEKLERPVPIWVHHLKPGSAGAIREELQGLLRSDLKVLRDGEILAF
jgi:ribonuclease BN (tRNA processing enzyme)